MDELISADRGPVRREPSSLDVSGVRLELRILHQRYVVRLTYSTI